MDRDLQSIIAIGIVVLTFAVFLKRFIKPGKKSGCGQSCGCGKKDGDVFP